MEEIKVAAKLDESIIEAGFLDSFDFVLADCDGVLWLGNEPIPGSVETINTLAKMGKTIIYVTNNGTKTRAEYVTKLTRLGFPAQLENIFSTSYCAAEYLKRLKFKQKAYVSGEIGIGKELEGVGIQYLPVGPDPIIEDELTYVNSLELDPDVGAVVIGFDRFVSFPKLVKIASYLKNPDCLFIALSREMQFFFSKDPNIVVPGSGTFVAAIEAVTNRQPVVLGKPYSSLLESIKQHFLAFDPQRSIMIGDRLDTDIVFGTKHRIRTLFVESGRNTMDDVHSYEKSSIEEDKFLVPDYYAQCFGELGKLIEKN